MSSAATPKEQLTAYQRWELDSFDAPQKGHKAAILPTAAQLERLHQQAHEVRILVHLRHGLGHAHEVASLAEEAE